MHSAGKETPKLGWGKAVLSDGETREEVGTDTFSFAQLNSAHPVSQCLPLKTKGIWVMTYNVGNV